MSDCNVCAEKYNKTKKCKVVCNKCDFEVCRECAKKYLVDLKDEFNCMSCKQVWHREFLSINFEKVFMSKLYKLHRENILFNREMSMMQATQPYVVREINKEKNKYEQIELKLKYKIELIKKVKTFLGTLQFEEPCQDSSNCVGIIGGLEYGVCNVCKKQRNLIIKCPRSSCNGSYSDFDKCDLCNEINLMRLQYKRDLELSAQKYVEIMLMNCQLEDTNRNKGIQKKKFIRKCPKNDCRGFLSTALKCDLCENYACKDCHEIVGLNRKANHTCLEENVKSVQLLMKDSKACPKCSSLTYKISGCSQIWCIECHTAWDWNTGKIDLGKIHNPHYHEYIRKNSIQMAGDRNNCAVDGDFRFNLFNLSNNNYYLQEIARCVLHIHEVERRRFSRRDRLENNLQLRIDFMRNKITEKDFKKKIQIKEKKNEKYIQIDNVLEMYVMCMRDILYSQKPLLNDYFTEIENLRQYTNECFVNIGKTFNSKVYKINNNFYFI